MIKNDAKEALKAGTILEGGNFRYKIAKVLGLGSFGITYLADIINANGEKTNMQVALKELFISECNERNGEKVKVFSKEEIFKEFLRKFSREAKNLHNISHDNIINVFEWFEANDTVYYSMTYIPGGSLSKVIEDKGKLRETEALETAEVIADALEELHSVGLLHLDVRPDNIMMNGGKVPVLIDFGFAHHFDENGEPDTSIGLGNGTPGYSPMERGTYQPGNGVPCTIDVYSLGATLFKMLTGTEPPTSSDIFNYGFPVDELHKAGVSDDIIAIVEKAMSPLWKDRYQTAGQMRKALRVALHKEEKEESAPAAAEQNTDRIAPMPKPAQNSDEEEATRIELPEETQIVPTSGNYNNADESTRIELPEETQIVRTGYSGSDEMTRIEGMPPMVGQPMYPATPPKKNRNALIAAIAAIATIVVIIVVCAVTNYNSGWLTDLFHSPVETVVLE